MKYEYDDDFRHIDLVTYSKKHSRRNLAKLLSLIDYNNEIEGRNEIIKDEINMHVGHILLGTFLCSPF